MQAVDLWLTDARLAQAVRKGWITPPLRTGMAPPSRAPVTSIDALMRELSEDRDDR